MINENELFMKRYLIQQMCNEIRSNLWIIVELTIVSVVLWVIFSFFSEVIMIRTQNYGYDCTDVLAGDVKEIPVSDLHPEDESRSRIDDVNMIVAQLRANPYVEFVGLGKNARPYQFSFWGERLSFTEDTTYNEYLGNVRQITPEVIRIFKIESTDGKSTDQLAKVIEDGDWIVGEFDRPFMPEQKEAKLFLNKNVIVDRDSSVVAHIGATARSLQRSDYEGAWGGSIYKPLGNQMPYQILIRVKSGKTKDFMASINSSDLTYGHVFVSNLQSLKNLAAEGNLGIETRIRDSFVCAIFMLFIIFLGFLGTYWFRTQQRVSEIAIRKVNGAVNRDILARLITEGLILFCIAAVPAGVIGYLVIKSEIMDSLDLGRTHVKYLYGAIITIVSMLAIISAGIIFPARSAMKINPAEALKDQ